MAKESDKKTLDLIKEVNKRKAEICLLERPNWKTNCSFSYIEGNMSMAVNIHVQNDVKDLVSIAAFLREKERAYSEAATTLCVEDAPNFTWCGFSVEDWISDIKTRINKIQIASKKAKLEKLESRLNSIISAELRAQMELEAIESELL